MPKLLAVIVPYSVFRAVIAHDSGDTWTMLNTRVDAVWLDGERATATVHTSVVVRGVLRQTPPADIGMSWVDGRWLID